MRVLVVLLTALFLSCQTKHDGFVINGQIEGVEDSTLVILYDVEQQMNIYSAFSKNGKFVLQGNVEQPTGYWLRCGNEYANIQVENLEMTFTSPIENMNINCKITGGEEQRLQNKLQELQRPYDVAYLAAYDSLVGEKYATEEEKRQLIDRFNTAQAASQQIYIDFGKRHADSYLGLDIIYRNRQSIARDSLITLFEGLPPSLKTASNAEGLRVFLYEEIAAEGKPFIDFNAKTLDEKNFMLSSLRGKHIYLSFWSAGCGPCRMENKFFSENFERVPEDLAIVSFSLDKGVTAWVKASEQDSILWHNVSDLKGGSGKVKTQYGVQAMPTSFLIDKNGTIIKKFVGFDPQTDIIDELVKKIEESHEKNSERV